MKVKNALDLEKQKLKTIAAKSKAKVVAATEAAKKLKEAAELKASKKKERKEEIIRKDAEKEAKQLKRKQEQHDATIYKENLKRQKLKDKQRTDLFRKEYDDEEEESAFETEEKIKIRLLDGEKDPPIPEEFKDELVFYHPIRQIIGWKVAVSYSKYLK